MEPETTQVLLYRVGKGPVIILPENYTEEDLDRLEKAVQETLTIVRKELTEPKSSS